MIENLQYIELVLVALVLGVMLGIDIGIRYAQGRCSCGKG
jgi:ABC-type proline/glycine betaine transport system permease subunit